jgi:hypothetical protein
MDNKLLWQDEYFVIREIIPTFGLSYSEMGKE